MLGEKKILFRNAFSPAPKEERASAGRNCIRHSLIRFSPKRHLGLMAISTVKRIIESLLHPAENDALKDQAIRQMASGAVTTLADIGAFKIGLLSGLHVLVASFFAMALAIVINFAITRRYVFGEIQRQRKGALVQFLIYVPAALVSIGLTQAVLFLFCVKMNLSPMPIKVLVAVPLVFLWTLFCGKYLIFNKREDSTMENL